MREVKETGWKGGGHHLEKLTKAEVQVPSKYFPADTHLFCIFFPAKWLSFQIILDAKDAGEDEAKGDMSRSSVADCLEHIEARLKLI